MEIGGEYKLEYYATPEFAVFNQVAHIVGGSIHTISLSTSLLVPGWTNLGTFAFSSGVSSPWPYTTTVPAHHSNQHVVADAIRLTRIGGWCGDGSCLDGEDCSSCPDDCTGEVEPENGIDDDCDGATDHASSAMAVSENGVSMTLSWGSVRGFYSEVQCTDQDKLCSSQLQQCVDIVCLDRENDRWCEGSTAMACMGGEASLLRAQRAVSPENVSRFGARLDPIRRRAQRKKHQNVQLRDFWWYTFGCYPTSCDTVGDATDPKEKS